MSHQSRQHQANRPHHPASRAQPSNAEDTVPVNAQVFEDNFNVLSQIINNYPTTNYTEGLTGSETDSSLGTSSQEHEKKPLTDSFKYYLLILFSSIYLIYGCQNSLLGPAMSDLARLLNTTSENISVALSLKNFIFSISTILVSFSFKIFGNRQLQYGGAVVAVGIITALTPHMTSFTQYLCGAVFSGFSSAFIDSVTNLVVLELWSLNSKVYMQIAHGAFTVGTIFGPLLVGPFLSKTDNSTIPSNGTTNDTADWTTTLAPTTPTLDLNGSHTAALSLDDQSGFYSRIQIPYTIVSCLLIMAAITMMISQILRPYVPEKRKLFAKQKSKKVVEQMEEQSVENSASMSSPELSQSSSANVNSSSSHHKKPKVETVCQQINLPKAYYRTFLGMTGVLLSIYSCVDGLTGMFMPSFLAKGELKIEKDEAAFMSSVVYMSMATGRLFTIIFALKTTCKILLFFNLSMTLLGYITLTFFAVHSKFITWISMFVIGGGLSSTYPLILSYIENRIVITNTVQLYLLFVGVLLLMFVPIIVGHFIDTAPMMFGYINVTLAGSALLLMLGIHFTDIWKKRLIKRIKEDQEILVEEED